MSVVGGSLEHEIIMDEVLQALDDTMDDAGTGLRRGFSRESGESVVCYWLWINW